MAARDVEDRIEIRGCTADVHGDDRLRLLRDGRLDQLRPDVQRLRIDVDEHRPGIEVTDHFRGCRERVGSGDDFVAGAHARSLEREVQRGSAGVDGDGMRGADGRRKFTFELFRFRAAGHPARAERFRNFADLVITDIRTRERKKRLTTKRWGNRSFDHQFLKCTGCTRSWHVPRGSHSRRPR